LLPADQRMMRDSAEAERRDGREHITVTFEAPPAPRDDEPSGKHPDHG